MIGSVFVAGSLHYDLIIEAPHLPSIDETVMGGPTHFACGGKGGNQAVAAAIYGARVAFAGCVGTDSFGARLEANLEKSGIDLAMLQHSDSASGMSVAIVDRNADYGAVVAPGANRHFDASACKIPSDAAILLLQNEISGAANQSLARRARDAGIKVFLNAAPVRPLSADLAACVDVLIMNRVEAVEWLEANSDTMEVILDLLHKRDAGPATVIVTLGREGLVLRGPDSPPGHMPGFDVDAISSHGAGDTFVGALAAKIASGITMADALAYAQAAAALFVSTPPHSRGDPDLAAIRTLAASDR